MTATNIRTKDIPQCKLCGSAGRTIYEKLEDRFFAAPGGWRMKQCLNPDCEMLWLDPAPIEEDLPLAYSQYFTHVAPGRKATLGERARGSLYKMYRTACAFPALLSGLGKQKQNASRMFLAGPPGRLLDVGCGDGTFLNRMKRRGWRVHGVDFDPKAIQSAQTKYGLTLHRGSLQSAAFPDGAFDAVTLNHVIEHIPEPLELLREARRVLAAGGQITITTPNSQSLGHQRFGEFWFGLDAPRHLQVFSPRALARLGEEAGFFKAQIFTTAAEADIFIGASISIRDSPGHRAQHLPRPSLLRTWHAVSGQFKENARIRIEPMCGEEAVLIAYSPGRTQ